MEVMAFAKGLGIYKPLLLPAYTEFFVFFYPPHSNVQIVASEV